MPFKSATERFLLGWNTLTSMRIVPVQFGQNRIEIATCTQRQIHTCSAWHFVAFLFGAYKVW